MGLPEMMTQAQFKQYYKQNPKTATHELAKDTARSHLGWDFTTASINLILIYNDSWIYESWYSYYY